jgi:AraC-like DNA-binding protein
VSIEWPEGLSAGFHAHLRRSGVPGLVHAGDQHAPSSWFIGMHSHDTWELYLQLTGPATSWAVGDSSWSVPPRGLLAVPPGVRHTMTALSTAPYHYYFAAMSPADILPPGDLHPLWRRHRPFTVADAGSLVAPFELFLREVTTLRPLRATGLAHTSALVLIEATRLAGGSQMDRPLALRPAIAHAQRLIEADLAAHLAVGDLAAAVHLSPAYFAELFRAETGQTPGQYRSRLRIERARMLLAETDMAITMIAADLGYSSSQHFATAFRGDTGTTPSQYRRRPLAAHAQPAHAWPAPAVGAPGGPGS